MSIKEVRKIRRNTVYQILKAIEKAIERGDTPHALYIARSNAERYKPSNLNQRRFNSCTHKVTKNEKQLPYCIATKGICKCKIE